MLSYVAISFACRYGIWWVWLMLVSRSRSSRYVTSRYRSVESKVCVWSDMSVFVCSMSWITTVRCAVWTSQTLWLPLGLWMVCGCVGCVSYW